MTATKDLWGKCYICVNMLLLWIPVVKGPFLAL